MSTCCAKGEASPSGNRTPVSRVTGGDTYHYTNEDWLAQARHTVEASATNLHAEYHKKPCYQRVAGIVPDSSNRQRHLVSVAQSVSAFGC